MEPIQRPGDVRRVVALAGMSCHFNGAGVIARSESAAPEIDLPVADAARKDGDSPNVAVSPALRP
jgi:hypothetical protein